MEISGRKTFNPENQIISESSLNYLESKNLGWNLMKNQEVGLDEFAFV